MKGMISNICMWKLEFNAGRGVTVASDSCNHSITDEFVHVQAAFDKNQKILTMSAQRLLSGCFQSEGRFHNSVQ